MNGEVVVDTDTIIKTKKEMLDKLEELKVLLTEIQRDIDESKMNFDTPFASSLRNRVNEVIESKKNNIDSRCVSYINRLDYANKRYDETNDAIERMIS